MFTVTRRDGIAIAMAPKAARTRSRASLTDLSGRPTMAKPGKPAVIEHCTSTRRAVTPMKATEYAIATTLHLCFCANLVAQKRFCFCATKLAQKR